MYVFLPPTNVELEEAVAGKDFRADLFHRLAVFRIHIPPLRHRLEDIPILVDHFLDTFTSRYEKTPMQFTDEALQALKEYSWPGNIRELRNVVERMVVETNNSFIGKNALAEWARERLALTGNKIPSTPVYSHAPNEQLALPEHTGDNSPADSVPLTVEMIHDAYRKK